jgi:hypothetical protein
MDYLSNCIFVDESGFDINMRRSCGWSKRGTEAVITTPSARGVFHTVIGAISAIGVVNLSMRESGNVKRRKDVGATKRRAPQHRLSVPKGTTGGHYLQFLNDTMDITDEFPEMKGYFIVMDNAPIHVPQIIEASEAVPIEHLRAFIQHSVNQFDNCLNKVAIKLHYIYN